MYKKIGILFLIMGLLFSINSLFFERIYSFINYYLFMCDKADSTRAILYAISVIFSLYTLALLVFQRNKFLYFISLFFLVISYIINLTYNEINGEGFSYEDLKVIVLEGQDFGIEALYTFGNSIFFSVTILFIFMIIISILRYIIQKQVLYISYKVIYISLIISILGTYGIYYKTGGITNQFPAVQKIIDTLLFYNLNKQYSGKRDELTTFPKNKSKYKNIIWIIDESVGWKYLSVNGYERETTPYLKTLNNHMINLGRASSGTNTSRFSNLILESGIQLKMLPDKTSLSLKEPSIYNYAKNAGYVTSYVSGQSFGMRLQNYMTKYDLEMIDNFIQPKIDKEYKEEKKPERLIVEATKNILNKNKKNFIYIVKTGVHYHYERAYPAKYKKFIPTLEKGEAMTLKNKNRIINSYLNGINWKVDEFFKYFFKETNLLDREDTIVIYTSDHGQSILENGIRATHATTRNPPKSQGIVPLLLFVKEKEELFTKVQHMKNHATHFMIFPTTCKWMGYEVNNKTLYSTDINSSQKFYHGNLFGVGSGSVSSINNF